MKKKTRRVLLFVPGSSPALLRTATVINADSLIFDLEDAVAPSEKDSARYLVKHATQNLSFGKKEIVVRINSFQSPWGYEDLEMVSGLEYVDTVMIPKATPETVKETEKYLEGTEKEIIGIIESAYGLQKAYEAATASSKLSALQLGAEDLSVDMNYERLPDREELLFARHTIVLASHASNVQPIDTPYISIDDLDGLKNDTIKAKSLGFTAKVCISPLHVPVIKEAFTPTEEEVAYAKRVIQAAEEAEKKGLGAIQVDGNMVDLPLVLRARRTLSLVEEER